MTNRLPSAPIRRTVALLLLTIGLHVLALLLIAPHVGGHGGGAIRPPTEIETRLIAAAPPPPATPPRPPKPSRPPKAPRPPKPRLAPAPAPADQAATALATAAPADIAPVLAPLPVAPSEAGAASALTDVESLQVAVAPVAGENGAARPDSLVGRAYRADVPPSSRIVLEVGRKDADGTRWHGEAAMTWQVDGGKDGRTYSMKLEAGIRVLVTRVNLVVLESSGQVDETGFAPRTMSEKRRGRAATVTRFGDAGDAGEKISFTASPATYAMAPGTQDKATVPLQLAAIARGDSEQLKGNIDLLVGEDKDASVFRFVLVGQEVIDTPMGKLATWHLSRPPRPGAYGSRLDVWLAPSLGWLPVRIDNIESSGATTTQTVKHIDRAG